MDYDEIKQTRVVHAETFDAFEREYNRAMCELSGCEVHEEPMKEFLGQIVKELHYTIEEKIREDIRDDYHEDDDVHHCIECPFLEDPNDNRRMWCRCSRKELRTRKDSEVCPFFYRELAQGKIEPVER